MNMKMHGDRRFSPLFSSPKLPSLPKHSLNPYSPFSPPQTLSVAMELELDTDSNSTPKLPLLSIQTPPSPDHSGMVTPPFYTVASVPFHWEEEPGKPRPSTALIPYPTTTKPNNPKSLDLPPRLLLEPSPTTVIYGPYRAKFTSSSFRFFKERLGSFDSSDSTTTITSPQKGQFSKLALDKKLHKERIGLIFGSWRQKSPKLGEKEGGESSSSFVHPSSVDAASAGSCWSEESSVKRVNMSKITSNGSFSGLRTTQARSHFWAAVYEGFKQVIPWKNKKAKKVLI